MDIAIVQQVQKLANSFLDKVFSFATKFGEIIPFIVIFFLLYWCVDNKIAMKFLFTYLIGVAINEFIKHLFMRPRPFDESSLIINKYNSSGYSFPSGHSASVTLAFGGAYNLLKNNLQKHFKIFYAIVNMVIILIVMFSRIYLGQHYLSDVLCGFLFAVLWIIIASKLYDVFKNSDHKAFLLVCPVAVLIAFLSCSPFIISDKFRIIYLICGLFVGVLTGYFLDRQFVIKTKKSALFLIVKGLLCTLLTAVYLVICIVLAKHLITYFVLFMLLGILTTYGFSVIFEKLNIFLTKRKNKNENV